MIVEDDAALNEAPLTAHIGDTETCGLPPHHYPCEIALIEIDPITIEPIWEIRSLIDPQYEIGAKAQEIHGISNEMVADEPTLVEFVEIRMKGKRPGRTIMIAHNAQFDIRALSECATIAHTVCTLFEARQVFTAKACPSLENHKLETLAKYFNFPPAKAHSALGDCETTRHLLKKILEESGRTLFSLATATDRVVHTMPWGEHKGKLLHQVPTQYCHWLLTRDNLEPNLRTSIKKSLELRK